MRTNLMVRLFSAAVAVGTLVATIWLYIIIPKGLLPQQDTGMILGITDAAQSISFASMLEKQKAISEIVKSDVDVASVASIENCGSQPVEARSLEASATSKG